MSLNGRKSAQMSLNKPKRSWTNLNELRPFYISLRSHSKSTYIKKGTKTNRGSRGVLACVYVRFFKKNWLRFLKWSFIVILQFLLLIVLKIDSSARFYFAQLFIFSALSIMAKIATYSLVIMCTLWSIVKYTNVVSLVWRL